ncbi:efflux transporter periplasmic adaptor subunit [Wenyingzhuangia fucanilytica]|uniref:Efflux transporter periplasmic adaptor subunit n=1 Tax=Wenyingzhuangia fucanilytica TaxID=1790137 RepID=A0A1B1Y497_9FLAO|nr:efflux RND transporter periplasmic adaptor subunit [Wenyingzhuangia fucanilytica]ANW95573.1 efflux transporter periplasmic adaptor subunit [Wenyingzhuangia fucanilytica]
MKKYSIYIVILVIGVLLGWLLFGHSNTTEKHEHGSEEKEMENQMWTCSMHPNIMKTEPGDCPICGMDLIPTTMSKEEVNPNQFQLTKNAMALAAIETTVVENSESGNQDIVLSGLISENQDKTSTQSAHFDGRVEKLYVTSLGQVVKKGQPVAEVYAPELITAQQELIIAAKTKNTQPALYNAVRNKFKNWYIHEHQLDEIEKTGKVKTNMLIYAHVAGTVTDILVDLGAHIMMGKPILKVADLSTVWANFDVYENQLSLFKVGQEIEVVIPSNQQKTMKGKVSFIDPVLNEQTRTVSLRVVLNNKNKTLKPGMFAEGKIKNKTEVSNQIQIPETSVLWTGKRSVVYVKVNKEQPTFELREVTLGNKIGNNYIVLYGLKNGEEIVTQGTFTVDAAAQLQGKKSMMNTDKSKSSDMQGMHMNH